MKFVCRGVVVLTAFMFAPRLAWAGACGTWDAGLSVTPLTDHPSAAFATSWSSIADCGTFTFDHYELCRLPGPVAPSTPTTTGAECAVKKTVRSATSAEDWVHRSAKEYSYRIFACDNMSCTDWYGTAFGEATTGLIDEENWTATERWVLVGVNGYSDTDRAVSSGNASAALIYPSGFTNAGSLGLWWSDKISGVETIRYKRVAASVWPNFNTTTAWTTTTDVIEAASGGTGRFGTCTHPWVSAVDDGSAQSIRLFTHCDEEGRPDLGMPAAIYSFDSVDEDGTDFAMECTVGTGCVADTDTCANGELCDFEDDSMDGGAAVEEICSDGTAACDYLTNAAHGRLGWDYVAYGAVNYSVDEPMMLFTGKSCLLGADRDDVFQAGWDATGALWDVPSSGPCATTAADLIDLHDPGIIPLPDDEFKAYLHDQTTAFYVCYFDGTDWGDCAQIELAFDDGTTLGSLPTSPDLGDCLENVDALVRVNGTTISEGAFFKTNASSSCFTVDGIRFAEHRN